MVKKPPANAGDAGDMGLIPESEDLMEEGVANHSLQVSLPGDPHGQRNLVGYSLWGCKELDMTEHTHTHTCISQKGKERMTRFLE